MKIMNMNRGGLRGGAVLGLLLFSGYLSASEQTGIGTKRKAEDQLVDDRDWSERKFIAAQFESLDAGLPTAALTNAFFSWEPAPKKQLQALQDFLSENITVEEIPLDVRQEGEEDKKSMALQTERAKLLIPYFPRDVGGVILGYLASKLYVEKMTMLPWQSLHGHLGFDHGTLLFLKRLGDDGTLEVVANNGSCKLMLSPQAEDAQLLIGMSGLSLDPSPGIQGLLNTKKSLNNHALVKKSDGRMSLISLATNKKIGLPFQLGTGAYISAVSPDGSLFVETVVTDDKSQRKFAYRCSIVSTKTMSKQSVDSEWFVPYGSKNGVIQERVEAEGLNTLNYPRVHIDTAAGRVAINDVIINATTGKVVDSAAPSLRNPMFFYTLADESGVYLDNGSLHHGSKPTDLFADRPEERTSCLGVVTTAHIVRAAKGAEWALMCTGHVKERRGRFIASKVFAIPSFGSSFPLQITHGYTNEERPYRQLRSVEQALVSPNGMYLAVILNEESYNGQRPQAKVMLIKFGEKYK